MKKLVNILALAAPMLVMAQSAQKAPVCGRDASLAPKAASISTDVTGRTVQYEAKPERCAGYTGTVVLNITVNKAGYVVKAEPDTAAKVADTVVKSAKDAALHTTFNPGDEQTGSITYTF